MPKSVKALRRSINVAFIAALIEAIEWPDTNLCRELFQGFRTAGDLRDQDSGVFRPSDDISELVGAHWQRIPLSEVPSGVGASHAALAPARDLESWRRGFIVSPQARRPSSFAELSFQSGGTTSSSLGSLVLASRTDCFASGTAPPPTEIRLAREVGPSPGGAPRRFHF